MQIPEQIQALIDKYQVGTISAEEKQLLDTWYHSFNDEEATVLVGENISEEILKRRIKSKLDGTTGVNFVEEKQPLKWRLPAAIASALLVLGIGSYFYFATAKNNQSAITTNIPTPKKTLSIKDIAPGGNKAILTLADGTQIVLDSASNGLLSQQGDVKIQKLNDGKLVYNINGKTISENDEAFYNTISTPRGGQYQITLADGTKVWLNASSSIKFPVVFIGSERKVEITGEAYFEVAKNANLPFKVNTPTSLIEVLGTHFNVNAYSDENFVKTTLIEGKVKVSVPNGNTSNEVFKFLTPGQQSAINKTGKIDVLPNADIEEAMAWKNGRFQFKSADLKTILRQISRWYDVDVEYYGDVNLHFTGQLNRNANVSKVFEKLELTGVVRFVIDGRKIIVSPK